MSFNEPIRVLIAGAAGRIGYILSYLVAQGEVFGLKQPIILHLFGLPEQQNELNGLAMELTDCAMPHLHAIVATTGEQTAFTDVAAVFMVGSKPRQSGSERKDLLADNVTIFKEQGQALDRYARKDVKVLVVANPANTNCLVAMSTATSIPRENFSALTRLDHNRGLAQLAQTMQVPVCSVNNVIIWGNHSTTQYPDASQATVSVNGERLPVSERIEDPNYLRGSFIETVQNRGTAVMEMRQSSSVVSAAKAACDHMKYWWLGTAPGEHTSMAVVSDGSYGIPKDIIFSFPVKIQDRTWSIVQNIPIDDFSREKLDATANELMQEKLNAEAVCGPLTQQPQQQQKLRRTCTCHK